MKRILVCLLCLLLAVSAAACGGASSGESSGGISPPPETSAGAESADAADVSVVSEVSSESDASDDSDVSDELSAPDDVSAAAQKSTPSERYDAMTARMMEGNLYFAIRGSVLDSEIEVAVAERGGVLCTKSEMLGAVSYVVVKDGKSYSFDLTEPVYMVSDEDDSSQFDDTVFVSEGTEELDGKTYDCVVRASAEDETQTMTFFFDGDTLYAIRYTMALGDTTVDSLLSVTALSDEIPDDMLFDVPEGYTEYSFSDDDTSVNENAEFPSELPEFTAGTLMMAEEVGGEYTFAYADTTQADCDAYIAALTADGFTDVGLEDVFTATKDGMVIAVYFSEGVTAISYAPLS